MQPALDYNSTIIGALELSEKKWVLAEVDLDRAVWSIPKERMKMGKPHDVPLSDAALDILRDLEATRGKNPHVFPGRPRRPLSGMSMSMLVRRMKLGATVHGFRSSFRTWCSDVAHIEFEVAEHCLAHVVGNSASQAYNRSTMLERRRPVMTAWATFLSGRRCLERSAAAAGSGPVTRGLG